MDYLHDRIVAADCIVLASPIYCMGLAAQAGAGRPGAGLPLPNASSASRSSRRSARERVGIFLSTAGQTWENVFDAAIPSVKCFFNVIDVRGRDIRYC